MTDGLKICPYCREEIKEKAIKCQHCGEFLDEKIKLDRENPSLSKKSASLSTKQMLLIIGGVIIFFGVLSLFLIKNFILDTDETRQGIYYPPGLTHVDGEQIYGPIFKNYKACEEWGLYQLSNEMRDSMCISDCDGTIAGLPSCDKVIRSRKPFQNSETFSGADKIRMDILNEIERKEKEREEKERLAAQKKAEEERAEAARQEALQKEAAAAKKKMCDEAWAKANKEIAEIQAMKSSVFCDSLHDTESQIAAYKNKINNISSEAASAFKGDVPQYIVDSYKSNKVSDYRKQIDILEGTLLRATQMCSEEQRNNARADDMILQRKQTVSSYGC